VVASSAPDPRFDNVSQSQPKSRSSFCKSEAIMLDFVFRNRVGVERVGAEIVADFI